MRASVGGCVENRFANWTLRPVNGLMMNMWATAGETVAGGAICLEADSSFLSELASASGSPDR